MDASEVPQVVYGDVVEVVGVYGAMFRGTVRRLAEGAYGWLLDLRVFGITGTTSQAVLGNQEIKSVKVLMSWREFDTVFPGDEIRIEYGDERPARQGRVLRRWVDAAGKWVMDLAGLTGQERFSWVQSVEGGTFIVEKEA
jgi:hypothetical protein